MKGLREGVLVDLEKRFIDDIVLLRSKGFNPIGVAVMVCENTFCFETEVESIKAFKTFEESPISREETIQGWWYGKKYFLETVKEYEAKNGYKVDVTWLNF